MINVSSDFLYNVHTHMSNVHFDLPPPSKPVFEAESGSQRHVTVKLKVQPQSLLSPPDRPKLSVSPTTLTTLGIVLPRHVADLREQGRERGGRPPGGARVLSPFWQSECLRRGGCRLDWRDRTVGPNPGQDKPSWIHLSRHRSLPIYLSGRVFAYLPIYLSIYLSIYLLFYLSI